MQVLHILLLVFIISCAVSVSLTKNLLTALVIFMGQSLAMSVIWNPPTLQLPKRLSAQASRACFCS